MIFKKTSQEELTFKLEKYKEEIKTLEKVDFSPLYNQDVAYHNYGYIHTFRVISDGLRLQNIKQFSAGMLAGIWIGLAYIAALIASYSFSNVKGFESLSKIAFSLVFSCVIILISFLGGGFVTAHMWYNRTMFKGVERWTVFLKACGLVYAGNIIGVLLVVVIFQLSGTMQSNKELWKYFADTYVVHKLYAVGSAVESDGLSGITASAAMETLLWTTSSAILCNLLICLATQGSKSAKGNTVAAMIMYFIILFYFAIGGYQHCVANWFIAWMIITEYAVNYSYGLNDIFYLDPNFSWVFLVFNIIPAIIGNFIGGLIIGWIMSMFNKDYDALLIKEARLRFLKEETLRLESKDTIKVHSKE